MCEHPMGKSLAAPRTQLSQCQESCVRKVEGQGSSGAAVPGTRKETAGTKKETVDKARNVGSGGIWNLVTAKAQC